MPAQSMSLLLATLQLQPLSRLPPTMSISICCVALRCVAAKKILIYHGTPSATIDSLQFCARTRVNGRLVDRFVTSIQQQWVSLLRSDLRRVMSVRGIGAEDI